jgi:hypothetical protein
LCLHNGKYLLHPYDYSGIDELIKTNTDHKEEIFGEREKNEPVFFTPRSREHDETAGIRYTWARNFIFLFFFRKTFAV